MKASDSVDPECERIVYITLTSWTAGAVKYRINTTGNVVEKGQ
jgi:hypothetical protein